MSENILLKSLQHKKVSICKKSSLQVSIECRHSDSIRKLTNATEHSLAELCAYLLEKFWRGIDNIIRQYDVTDKQYLLYWSHTKYYVQVTVIFYLVHFAHLRYGTD